MCHIVGVFPHEHAQYATWINTELVAALLLWTGWSSRGIYIIIAGMALATIQLATTLLPECSHKCWPDFIFSKTLVWEENFHSGIFPKFLIFKVSFSSLQCGWGHRWKCLRRIRTRLPLKQILLLYVQLEQVHSQTNHI